MKRIFAKKDPAEPRSMNMVEEAFALLRRAPAEVWVVYLGATIPFLLLVLFGWSDLARAAYADERTAAWAFILAVAFGVMKAGQARFATLLRTELISGQRPEWTFRDWVHVWITQTFVQPTSFLILPVAMVLTFPVGWVFAFYQTILTLRPEEQRRLRPALAKAWQLTALWPQQNHLVLLIISGVILLGLVSWIQVLAFGPQLVKLLTGSSSFLSTGLWAFANTTFLAVLLALTYLTTDPLIKAVYVLRAFYGESLRTGEDLSARWEQSKTQAKPTAMLVLVCLGGWLAMAEPVMGQPQNPANTSPAPARTQQMDAAIDSTLNDPEFAWRLPRDRRPAASEEEPGLITRFVKSVNDFISDFFRFLGRMLERLFKWLEKQFGDEANSSGGKGLQDFPGLSRALLWILVAVVVYFTVRFALRFLRQARVRKDLPMAAVVEVPNLEDESVTADQMPEGSWRDLAGRLATEGDLRKAMRALFLAGLARLAENKILVLERYKTNLDYAREVSRKARATPAIPVAFSRLVTAYEQVWYGGYPASPEGWQQFQKDMEVLQNPPSSGPTPPVVPPTLTPPVPQPPPIA